MRTVCIGTTICKGVVRADLIEEIDGKCKENEEAKFLFQNFCLCNDIRVIPPKSQQSKFQYDGASQDELIFVKLAQDS